MFLEKMSVSVDHQRPRHPLSRSPHAPFPPTPSAPQMKTKGKTNLLYSMVTVVNPLPDATAGCRYCNNVVACRTNANAGRRPQHFHRCCSCRNRSDANRTDVDGSGRHWRCSPDCNYANVEWHLCVNAATLYKQQRVRKTICSINTGSQKC